MSVIWKYTMQTPRAQFDMPAGAVPLSVGVQGHGVVIWARVDPGGTRQPRAFEAVGTGRSLPRDWQAFIGTVQDGWLVWHIFEVVA